MKFSIFSTEEESVEHKDVKSCSGCQHSEEMCLSGENVLCCTRYPRIPCFDGVDIVNVYPIVEIDDCCGEFKFKLNA